MTATSKPIKLFRFKCASLFLTYLIAHALFMIVPGLALAEDATAPTLPLFRHIDGLAKPPNALAPRKIRLLTDADFPPFSFETPEGKAAGVSIDLALSACAELKVDCVIIPKPFDQLLPALLNNEGDVIASGLKINEAVLKKTAMTRPYFWSLGRFAVRLGSQLRNTDIRSLASKRIGFVAGTSHAAWLKKYYSRSVLTTFPGEPEMYEALRTGALDAIFGDDLRLIYWLAGNSSRNCCKTLDGAYVDRQFFSRNLAFLARREDQDIVHAFDYALDRLQDKGTSSEIFSRYLPNGLW